jgi:predicted ATPase
MKTITLENGAKVQISDESYKALQEAVKSSFKDVVKAQLPSFSTQVKMFEGWSSPAFQWLNNPQSQKEFNIYLHMLLWKETYDKDFVPDWEDYGQTKWRLACTFRHHHNMQVYVSTEEKALQMLEDLKAVGVIE